MFKRDLKLKIKTSLYDYFLDGILLQVRSGDVGAGLTCSVWGRQDGGHLDPPGLQLVSQRFRQQVESSFGGSVCRQTRERLVAWKHRWHHCDVVATSRTDQPTSRWVRELCTGWAGDVDDASFGLSQQRQEAPGDTQCPKEVDLHAATEVGHQRQLYVTKVHAHPCVVHQTPQTCKHTNTRALSDPTASTSFLNMWIFLCKTLDSLEIKNKTHSSFVFLEPLLISFPFSIVLTHSELQTRKLLKHLLFQTSAAASGGT